RSAGSSAAARRALERFVPEPGARWGAGRRAKDRRTSPRGRAGIARGGGGGLSAPGTGGSAGTEERPLHGKGPRRRGPLFRKDVPPANPAAGPSVLQALRVRPASRNARTNLTRIATASYASIPCNLRTSPGILRHRRSLA